ncbi:MAG: enoyl-CoA hydratase/isomerase family protein [Candidatus Lambdaproteobacteria bacterium]|nr:enoyl-CoA hydratase/isomerase family protein [Candidatus Lambdaproteobacteria bacterium]
MPSPTRVELNVDRRGVARVTLHSENRMNPLSSPTMDALLEAGTALMTNRRVRLVVLTGAGEKSFIAGMDLHQLSATTSATMALQSITRVHQVCHLFRTLPVPSIARVNGYCLGAGMELAACCDIRVGADHSRYGMPEVRLGRVSVVEASVLPSLLGWGKARELIYRGTMMDADEAYRTGFLQAKAPLAELDAAMAPMVEDILAAEPNAVRAQKRLIESWLDDTGVLAGVQKGIDTVVETHLAGHTTARVHETIAALKARNAGKAGAVAASAKAARPARKG